MARTRITRMHITLLLKKTRNFSGRDLSGFDFSNMTLQFVDFSGCNLTDANFTGADLNGATFFGAILHNTNFSDANLRYSNLDKTDMRGATFSGAHLGMTSLLLGDIDDEPDFAAASA